jgi:hypothetical protein
VALVAPVVDSGEAHPMLWAAVSGMRFRSPDGYVFIPGPLGSQVDPPYTVTHATLRDMALGRESIETIDSGTRQKILSELSNLHVQTVIIGPMAYQSQALVVFDSLFNRPPEYVGGVYIWWDVMPHA